MEEEQAWRWSTTCSLTTETLQINLNGPWRRLKNVPKATCKFLNKLYYFKLYLKTAGTAGNSERSGGGPHRRIKLQLWDDQIGLICYGKCDQFTSLTTREFDGELFITTTKETEIQEIPSWPGLGDIIPHKETEQPVTAVSGVINRPRSLCPATEGIAHFEFFPKTNFTVAKNATCCKKRPCPKPLPQHTSLFSKLVEDGQDVEEDFLIKSEHSKRQCRCSGNCRWKSMKSSPQPPAVAALMPEGFPKPAS